MKQIDSKPRYVLYSFIAALIVMVFWFAFYGSSSSSFCMNCHEMKNNHSSWASSGHSKVACTVCHIGPGTVDQVTHKVSSLKEVANHFTSSYSTPINKDSSLSKEIASDACLGCHKLPTKTVYGLVKFTHKNHIKTNCAYCHNRVAHNGLKGYLDRRNMAFCIDCHKKKKKPLTCNACHPTGITQKPASHLSGNWVSTHEKSVAKYCNACHDKAFCDNCHKNPNKTIPPTHKAADWQKIHKTVASKDCKKNCHEQKYCDHCHHGFYEMPESHKTGKWLTVHIKEADAVCATVCHKSSFCINCHSGPQVRPTSHKKTDWTYSHQFVSNPSCVARCHIIQDCNGCHINTSDQDTDAIDIPGQDTNSINRKPNKN